MFGSEDERLLFCDGGRNIATVDDVGLLQHLNGKELIQSIQCCFLAINTLPNPAYP
jgi:hypothetical protein